MTTQDLTVYDGGGDRSMVYCPRGAVELFYDGIPMYQPLEQLEPSWRYHAPGRSGSWWTQAGSSRRYKCSEVAAATGIPAGDLRAWEQATDIEFEEMQREDGEW